MWCSGGGGGGVLRGVGSEGLIHLVNLQNVDEDDFGRSFCLANKVHNVSFSGSHLLRNYTRESFELASANFDSGSLPDHGVVVVGSFWDSIYNLFEAS